MKSLDEPITAGMTGSGEAVEGNGRERQKAGGKFLLRSVMIVALKWEIQVVRTALQTVEAIMLEMEWASGQCCTHVRVLRHETT